MNDKWVNNKLQIISLRLYVGDWVGGQKENI